MAEEPGPIVQEGSDEWRSAEPGPLNQDVLFEQTLKHDEQRYKFRQWQSWAVFSGLTLWLLVVLVALYKQGTGAVDLSDPVLVALVVSWPGALAAYLVRMARYVFPDQPNNRVE
ncbi:MAG: hypothetical protein OXU68_02180 [Bacteroidota bacterium]|nr:hypothetical protein [Bacteroidota bacterium]